MTLPSAEFCNPDSIIDTQFITGHVDNNQAEKFGWRKINVNSVFIFVRHLDFSLSYAHSIIAQGTRLRIPTGTLAQPCRAWAGTRSCFSNRA